MKLSLLLMVSCVVAFAFAGAIQAQINLDNLAGAWLFEEGSGTTANDSPGQGNQGVIEGTPSWVAGQFGQALEFDGDDLVIIQDADSLDVNAMTVTAWINLSSYGDDTRIFTKEVGTVDPWSVYNFLISGDNDRKLEFRPTIGGVGGRARIASILDVPLDVWTHVAATFDTENVVIYINGEVDTEQPAAGELMQNDEPVYIGESQFYDRAFNGLMDDVLLFNTALEQADVQQIMNEGISTMLAVSARGHLAVTWAQLKN